MTTQPDQAEGERSDEPTSGPAKGKPNGGQGVSADPPAEGDDYTPAGGGGSARG